MQTVETDRPFQKLERDHRRATLLVLAERLEWDFPRISNLLQTYCADATNALVAELYNHLAAFPREFDPPTFDPLRREVDALPVCAQCGEPLDQGPDASPGPHYHGRCLRESQRLGSMDFWDPESVA